LELQLYVTAMHLSEFYGSTADEIRFPITAKIDMKIKEKNTKADMLESVSVGLSGFKGTFLVNKPDIVVVLGDRIEQYAASLAALFLGIPIAHIHGGDVSGGIDDYLRDMITLMATIHFPASEKSAQRIRSLIRDGGKIHAVGAPGLDSLLATKITSKAELSKKYGLDSDKEWALVLYHPDTLSPDHSKDEMKAILEVMADNDLQKIIIYPNSDAGSDLVIAEIDKMDEKPDFMVFKNIEHKDFVSMMANSHLMAGNSSSALIEAPSFGIPAINVGSRQSGRERASNIIDIPSPDTLQLKAAMDKALHDKEFLTEVKKKISPYGDGHASDRILKLVEKFISTNSLVKNSSDHGL
jgi:UDP-hydrolysing UDP-N-acetyl-D-glucosamine 2-epimerase